MMAEQWLRQRHGEIYIPGRLPSAPGVRAHLADANPTRFGEAVQGAGVRLHLADTSNGVNYSDADQGLKLHLADSRPFSGGEIAAAETGLKVHQTASEPSQPTEWRSRSATQLGLKVHLSEHSLDRGGVGDTSRAMEILNEGNSNR